MALTFFSHFQYYVKSFHTRNGTCPLIRRLVMIIGKIISMFEMSHPSNSIKESFANVIVKEIEKVMTSISTKRLWTELYLLEPSWLSMFVTRELALKMLPSRIVGTGLRPLIESMENKEVVDVSNDMVEQETDENVPTNVVNIRIRKVKKNQYGETDFHIASKKGDVGKLRQLLSTNPQLVNEQDNSGYTALHEAANHGHSDCVKLLLDYSANINIVSAGDYGVTPIQDAISNNKIEAVKLMLDFMRKQGIAYNEILPPLLNYAKSEDMKELINAKLTVNEIPVQSPERFCMLYSLSVTRYVAMYRIHAVLKIFKGLTLKKSQSKLKGPELELDITYPYRALPDSRLCDFSVKRDDECFVKDNRSYAKSVSKNPFKNPGLEMMARFMQKSM